MREESLQEIIKSRTKGPSSGQEIKRINQLPPPDEMQALIRAVSHVQNALTGYQTTVDEDELIIRERSEQLPRLMRNVVILRKEEKKILQHNLQHVQQHLKRIKRWFSEDL